MPSPVAIIVPSDLSGGGTALPRYRQLLADELGFLLETTVTASVSHGEARRVVLADDFRDDERGTDLVMGGGGYLYVQSGVLAGSQGRILSQSEAGYQGSRGVVVLARPLAAPLAVGTVVQVTSPLPIKRYLTTKGLDDCVNEALANTQAVATLTFDGAGSDRLSLEDYPFLVHADQILSVADRSGVLAADAAVRTGLPYRIDANGTTRYLALGRSYAAGETVEVAVQLPGDRLVYDGVAWSYVADQPGLHDENDRASVPEHWVKAFGMVAALRFLERLVRQRNGVDRESRLDAVAEIRDRRAQWARACLRLRLTELPRGAQQGRDGLLGSWRTDTTIATPGGWSGAGWP